MKNQEPAGPMLATLKKMVSGRRSDALKKGWEVDDDIAGFAITLYRVQHGCCAITGMTFSLKRVGTGQARRPFAPSLDRVDGEGGYTRDNVRLVCQMVNFALNRFGEDTFYKIARAAVAYIGQEPDPIERQDEDAQKQMKKRYIDFVADRAPGLLRAHGGSMAKDELREALRQSYGAPLPAAEGNAYGWAFRRLTENGIIHPASGNSIYELRHAPPTGRT